MSRDTRVIAVDRDAPDPAVIAAAARLLLDGGLVAFATETVYGLGAVATDPVAVARIFEAKERPAFNPLIVHGVNRLTSCETGRPGNVTPSSRRSSMSVSPRNRQRVRT